MKRKIWLLPLLAVSAYLQAQTEVRLAVHKSFSLPKGLIARFERANDAKVSIIQAGGANEMLNKLILSRANPIADAVYGLDNANIGKAREMGILAAAQPESAPVAVGLPSALAVDYGYVAINYDKKWFEGKKLPLPQTLQDLTRPEYKNLLVVPSPATSSPGLGFLMANISGLGEEGAFKWWAQMRQNWCNGCKVGKCSRRFRPKCGFTPPSKTRACPTCSASPKPRRTPPPPRSAILMRTSADGFPVGLERF